MIRAAGPGFDPAALERYLREVLPDLPSGMRLQPITGGQSNPTFYLSFGETVRLVLRKQPKGELLPSAHAIDREFRVQQALAGTAVPVPRPLHFCADRSVIGTPFYVMDRIDGRVLSDGRLPEIAAGDRRTIYRSLAETLAALHNVDPDGMGLGDYGRREGYFARQVARWTLQWQLSRQEDDANIAALIGWLPGHVPPDEACAVVHGDYRLGNVMLAPAAPRVAAILDWELSTLGHPLADLAHCCMAWHITPDEYGGMAGVDLAASGLPAQAEFEGWYGAAAGHGLRLRPFHMAFALFRFAVVFEGIAARARAGNAAAANAGVLGHLARGFAARASDFIA